MRAKWRRLRYINVHDGTVHRLDPPTLPVLPLTFGTIFARYQQHLELKSLAADGTPCEADTRGLLRRNPITAIGRPQLIGKETERSWSDAEDISTLLPSLVRYADKRGVQTSDAFRAWLDETSLDDLERESRRSRHTLVRIRRGQRVHANSLRALIEVWPRHVSSDAGLSD